MAGYKTSMLSTDIQTAAGRYVTFALKTPPEADVHAEFHTTQSLVKQGISKGPSTNRRAWQGHEMANCT